MACKDCIYCEACNQHLDEINNPKFTCAIFKDRSKFIELPCKVGDVFYGIDTYGINAYSCYGVGYGHISANKLGFLLFAVGRREYIFGKDAFLTEAEAKQALKEWNNGTN